MSKEKQKKNINLNKDIRGNSLDKHDSLEKGNQIAAEKELGQQLNNL